MKRNDPDENETDQAVHTIMDQVHKIYEKHGMNAIYVPLSAIVASLLLTGHGDLLSKWLIYPLYTFAWTIVGTAVGVGLGLGLATHVYDYLTDLAHRDQKLISNAETTLSPRTSISKGRSIKHKQSASSAWEEDTVYSSLMSSAGYDVSDHILRAQIIKRNSPFWAVNYPFTDAPDTEFKAVQMMKELMPHLVAPVSLQLGKFIEHIMRDYVSSWYSMVDGSVSYENEAAKRARKAVEEADKAALELNDVQRMSSHDSSKCDLEEGPDHSKQRAMLLSTIGHRPVPMMGSMYTSLVLVLGNLAQRVESVNLLSLILLKWTKVLGQTLKVYRKMRNKALAKTTKTVVANMKSSKRLRPSIIKLASSSMITEETEDKVTPLGVVSEMAVTREFLIHGKLHRAVVFGMDVPSLLYADSKGEECSIGEDRDNGDVDMDEDKVLEKRLFGTKMLYECELDYNRVLGNRLARALLPRAEYSSPLVRSMMTELLAACVLTPIMSCFCPSYLNGWILQACTPSPDPAGGHQMNETQPSLEEKSQLLVSEDSVEMRLEETDPWAHLQQSNVDQDGEQGQELTMSLTDVISCSQSTRDDPGIDSSAFLQSPAMKDLLDIEDDEVQNDDLPSLDDDEDTIDESDNGREHSAVLGIEDEKYEPQTALGKSPPSGDFLLPLLTMSLIELQGFFDLEDCREGKAEINWDDLGCQAAVTQLVLVLEAALIHGRRTERLETPDQNEADGGNILSLMERNDGKFDQPSKYAPPSLIKVLMDMTSNLEVFQDRIMKIEDVWMDDDDDADSVVASSPATVLQPSAQELSTTRTLIAAWLHSGQAHRVITVLMNAPNCLLVPFFHKHSFLRTPQNAVGFVRQLRCLDGVPILVDTMLVLSSASLDVNENGSSVVPKSDYKRRELSSLPVTPRQSTQAASDAKLPTKSGRFSRLMGVGASDAVETEAETSRTSIIPVPQAFGAPTPKYLDFRKNENFAVSLRSERDRRTQSWLSATSIHDTVKSIPVICRSKGASEASIAIQRELHQVSRILYAGTNMISLRSGGRRKNSGEVVDGTKTEILPLSLLTVEMASQKRRIEVPDEDSSFLLRAQPRPLVAIGVHRDPRNHDQSYKCFAATYEESVQRQGSSKVLGGRYIRRCLLKYYPNDRTASVELPTDGRQLDQRQDRPPESINLASSTGSLTNDFLKERHLCQKWTPKGSVPRSGSILASSVMETSDFTAAPRSGKAIDFVFRVSLFERPMVDLDGKKFTIHDSSAIGTHRADASSLEISDAALSHALLQIGRDWNYEEDHHATMDNTNGEVKSSKSGTVRRSSVEVGKDGYPVLFVKYNRKHGDSSVTEVKPYRSSYIRAAILITEARQEAQQTCLTKCVMSGSARSATKARTEALLWPTVTLLDYASSPEREKQSILLRDLKLGINHIDREQLRRNGLLCPRYPTVIRTLTAQIEGATTVKEPGHAILAMAPTVVLFRIRCIAVLELCDEEIDEEDVRPYKSSSSDAKLFREEWTVWRQFQDFATLHKQLKSQVAQAEQSVSAGARLVGVATAAFSVGGVGVGPRRRQALIPSLGQAPKTAGLGLTKKSIQKRCVITDAYLKFLLSPNHLLNRCSELLLFLGASYPLPSEVVTGGAPVNPTSDPFGRVEIIRIIHIAERELSRKSFHFNDDPESKSVHFSSTESGLNVSEGAMAVSPNVANMSEISTVASPLSTTNDESHSVAETAREHDEQPSKIAKIKEIHMIPAIKAKIEEVPLSQVRHAIFDLIRYQFDFDNASFFRNRMFAALKTMSFAVTTSGEFRKMLYENHVKFVNAETIAGWIQVTLDMLWPDGVFFTSSPPVSKEEEIEVAAKAKSSLSDAFPDQIKSVLGQNLTQNGLDMLHELLQNRVVTKSMAYMLFDLVWLEIFPELQDILTCGSVLEEE